MSRTLFFYIFRDLMRIFLLTSGALAGIMSFGGLLRPLTEHGLDAAQAARMLSYFMPAMTTYSLPIAALFATTVVYGRLAADNELVACRAAGISFLSIGLPAIVLGLTVALVSLLFLCFIVPVFTLKVEKVIYSNLAEIIANQVDRTHQIKFGKDTTIFAQEAAVAPTDAKHPNDQIVSLGGIMIMSYEKMDSIIPNAAKLQIPREFFLAKQATVFIHRSSTADEFTLEATLDRGAMFPRRFTDKNMQGGLEATQFGPIIIDSMIREQTKFMDIRRLHELNLDLRKSHRVQEQIRTITRALQQQKFLANVAAALAKPGGRFRFESGGSEDNELIAPKGGSGMRGGRLIVAPGTIREVQKGAGAAAKTGFHADAAEIELSATPMSDERLVIEARFYDAVLQTPEGPTARPGFPRSFVIPMPAELRDLETRPLDFYRSRDSQNQLNRELIRLGNGIQGEMHSRASFAVSCLILVVVGCCLGMMFKSGNFLTAFALSVVPALVCIALIVAGQHTCENVPWKLEHFQNPLKFGIALIWSGDAAVFALACVLWTKMQRQ
jgi:lipopolysaccharide export LptBFGC system permease protein LptF